MWLHVTTQYTVNIFTVKMLSAHSENPHSNSLYFLHTKGKNCLFGFSLRRRT